MKNHTLIEFGANLMRFIPDLNGHTAGTLGANLMRLAKRHQNLAIALCNGWIEQDEYDKKTWRVGKKMRDLLPTGRVELQGDPRGATSRLKFPRTGEGFGSGDITRCLIFDMADDFTVFIPTT